MKNWTAEKAGPVTVKLRVMCERREGWEQWGLLSADHHIDNPKTDRKLIAHHLRQAQDRDAYVVMAGDIFDAMQGASDRRGTKADLLADFVSTETPYFDALVKYAAEIFEPYREHIAVISQGNHESAISKHHESDITQRLGEALDVPTLGYRGWIRWLFESGDGFRTSRNGYIHHGSGGGGPVTKGVIQTNRRAVYLPDADYVVSGHIHEKYVFPIERVRLTSAGREYADRQYHVVCGTYKDEFFNAPGGFHHEKGGPPKPIGPWWIRHYYSPRTKQIEVQFLEADA